MKTGTDLIAEERARQISEERWSARHDDINHYDGALALAAACYALPDDLRNAPIILSTLTLKGKPLPLRVALWPWSNGWWKPTPANRVRELTKAGALIAAEIDRIQRATVHPK